MAYIGWRHAAVELLTLRRRPFPQSPLASEDMGDARSQSVSIVRPAPIRDLSPFYSPLRRHQAPHQLLLSVGDLWGHWTEFSAYQFLQGFTMGHLLPGHPNTSLLTAELVWPTQDVPSVADKLDPCVGWVLLAVPRPCDLKVISIHHWLSGSASLAHTLGQLSLPLPMAASEMMRQMAGV